MGAAGGNGSEPAYWDPYRPELTADPYPTFRRLREEAPLYYNEEYDFYAVSRFDDVQQGLRDHETFSSAKGEILELIKANAEMPDGVFIFEDPPRHTVHRGILARVFTPRALNWLEAGSGSLTCRSCPLPDIRQATGCTRRLTKPNTD